MEDRGNRRGLLIVLRALGLGAAWPQEHAPPRIDEEIAKQEKIYRSRGADVPSGYVTGRGLADYAELLPAGSVTRSVGCELGPMAGYRCGRGQAILDYYALEDNAAPAGKCARSVAKARVVAMSIEDRRTDKWQQQAAIFGEDHIRYLFGKSLRDYSPQELGKFQIITDVYGGFSYTEDLSQFMAKVLSLLESGGVFYTMVQGVHLEDGKNNPDTGIRPSCWMQPAAT